LAYKGEEISYNILSLNFMLLLSPLAKARGYSRGGGWENFYKAGRKNTDCLVELTAKKALPDGLQMWGWDGPESP